MQALESQKILFYDGECGFCDWSVQFVLARDAQKTFHYAPLQGITAKKLLPVEYTVEPLKSSVLYDRGTRYVDSDSVLQVLKELNAPWRWLFIFRFMPRILRDTLYHFFSRYRHLIIGKKNACRLLLPDEQQLFLP